MKKSFRSFTAGFICATLIFTTVGVGFASTGTRSLSAAFKNIQIFIDQSKITPKDANGNAVEPFIVDGTTYLPVRAVAEALGQQVSWDGATNSVYIGSQPVSGNTGANINNSISVVEEYTYSSMFGSSTHYIIVKNNGNKTVEISSNSKALGKNGNVIGAGSDTVNAVGPNCTSILTEYYSDVSDIASYDTKITAKEDEYYKSVIQNIELKTTTIDSGVVVEGKNNGSIAAQFVEAYALFFDANGKLVYCDSSYIVDSDSELKPGDSIAKQLWSYDKFASVKVYITGRSEFVW